MPTTLAHVVFEATAVSCVSSRYLLIDDPQEVVRGLVIREGREAVAPAQAAWRLLFRLRDVGVDGLPEHDPGGVAIEDADELVGRAEEIHLVEIGRAVQQECRDRSRMPSSA
eukprot:TRINITY_DN17344_c0_g1_i2.p1 TRINITY_DN17344_c0_g1~~TRINITY_DN17344_c0_g1_i2.p1  ORF type:complete len:112 (-),score=20.78 TRINITY_DN17344_c0_g1_i2:10-345(-)